MEIELTTYWNVETLYFVFNAIAAFMKSVTFGALMKAIFIFAIGIGMFAYMAGRQLEMITWFFQALVLVSLLNLPIAKVILTDKTGMESPKLVDNVPVALAIVAQISNIASTALTQSYETVFGVPDELGLARGDVGFGHRILKMANGATIRQPELRSDLMQFIKECTLYDVKDGEITSDEIVKGTSVFNVIFAKTSPARFVTYNTLSNPPVTDTCKNVAAILSDRVNTATAAAQTFYGKQAFTRTTDDAIATGLYVTVMGTSYSWLLSSSQSASDATKQAMFNNIWRDAGAELPALLNDPARIAEVNAMAGAAQAARQADGSNSVLTLLGQESLPHLRNWIEAIIYAMFPVIVIMMVAMSAEGAKKVLGGYMMALAWIGLWPVLFAVINHLSLMHLVSKMRALDLADGVPFQMMDVFDATLQDEQSIIGYMVVLVPFIAAGIIKMGQGGIMSIADKAISGVVTAGSAVGSGLASGNMSMGAASLDTASVNTTSMHKMDYNLGLAGGNANIGLAHGGSSTLAANGMASTQQMHNRFIQSMNTEHAFNSGAEKSGWDGSHASSGKQVSLRQGDAATISDLHGKEAIRGKFQNNATNVADTHTGGTTGSAGGGQSINKSDGVRSSFDQTSMGRDNLGLSAGSGGGGQGHVGGKYDPKEEKRIMDAMEKTGQDPIKARDNYRQQTGYEGGRSRLPFRFAGDIQKAATANHGRAWSNDIRTNSDEHARRERNYGHQGSHSETNGSGDQASQNNRRVKDANRSKVNEFTEIGDTARRNDQGYQTKAHQGESNRFALTRDLLQDPAFMEAVAKRNGMNTARFYAQETPLIMRQAQEYVEERGMVGAAKTMPTSYNNQEIPQNKNDVYEYYASEEDGIKASANIAAIHQSNVSSLGIGSTSPLKVDTRMPSIIKEAESYVDTRLHPLNSKSIEARTITLKSVVFENASPDRPVGDGRRSELAAAHEIVADDVKGGVRDIKNKIKDFFGKTKDSSD